MKKLLLVAMLLTAVIQATETTKPTIWVDAEGGSLKDKVAYKAKELSHKYKCWRGDGYTSTHTNLLGFTIKTYTKCKE